MLKGHGYPLRKNLPHVFLGTFKVAGVKRTLFIHFGEFQTCDRSIFVSNSIITGYQHEKSIQELDNTRSAGSFKEQHS